MSNKLFQNINGSTFKLIVESYDDLEDPNLSPEERAFRKDWLAKQSGEESLSDQEKWKLDHDAWKAELEAEKDKKAAVFEKKREAVKTFLKKNGNKIDDLYDNYATEELKNDPDVKFYRDYFKIYRRGKRDPLYKENDFTDIPDRQREYVPFVRGMIKIAALKNKSLADKLSIRFKNIFKE